MAEQTANKGNITEQNFKTILKKYGKINYEADKTTIKSITTNKGKYDILINEIFSTALLTFEYEYVDLSNVDSINSDTI